MMAVGKRIPTVLCSKYLTRREVVSPLLPPQVRTGSHTNGIGSCVVFLIIS